MELRTPEQSARPNFSAGQQPNTNDAFQPGQPSFGSMMAEKPPQQMSTPQAPAQQPQTFGQMNSQPEESPPSPQPESLPGGVKTADQQVQAQKDDASNLYDELMSEKRIEGKPNKSGEAPGSIYDDLMGDVTKPAQFSNEGITGMDVPKHLATSMMERVGRTPQEQMNIVQAMYGEGNAKLRTGKDGQEEIWFRAKDSGAFKKFDQRTLPGMYEYFMKDLLKAVPGAANVIMMGLGAYAGGAAGGPTGAATVSLAAGGASQALTQEGIIQGMGAALGQPVRDPTVSLKQQVKKDVAINLIYGYAAEAAGATVAAGKYISEVAQGMPRASVAVGKLKTALGIGEESNPAMTEKGDVATEGQITDANVKSAFEDLHEELTPNTMVTDKRQSGEQTGRAVASVLDLEQQRLENKVANVKAVVRGLTKGKDIPVKVNNLKSTLENELGQYGYTFDEYGAAIAPPDEGLAAASQVNLKRLVKINDSLASTTNASKLVFEGAPDASRPSGIGFDQMEGYLRSFKDASEYGLPYGEKASAEGQLNRRLGNAMRSDRDAHFNDVLKGTGLPEEALWKANYEKYASRIDSLMDLHSLIKDDVSRKNLVQSLVSKQKSEDAVRNIEKIRDLVAEDNPKVWDSFRGEVFSKQLDNINSGSGGVFNGKAVANWLGSAQAKLFRESIMTVDEEEAYKFLAQNAEKFQKSNGISDGLLEKFKDKVDTVSHLLPEARFLGKFLFKYADGNKATIDYLADDGLIQMARQARTPEQRKLLQETGNLLDNLRNQMGVFETSVGKSDRKVKKYILESIPKVAARPLAPMSAPMPMAAEQQPAAPQSTNQADAE